MSKTAYNISLKGYVGGFDFDRSDVDAVLAENEGKRVNVLIDSLGGSLATGRPVYLTLLERKCTDYRVDNQCILRGASEIRTRDTLLAYTRFPGVPLQPLEHRSFGFCGAKLVIFFEFHA